MWEILAIGEPEVDAFHANILKFQGECNEFQVSEANKTDNLAKTGCLLTTSRTSARSEHEGYEFPLSGWHLN